MTLTALDVCYRCKRRAPELYPAPLRRVHVLLCADCLPTGPAVTFIPSTPTGTKEACSVCGAAGYPWGRWKDRHLRGHLPCRRGCGKLLAVLIDGSAASHGRWPCTRPAQ